MNNVTAKLIQICDAAEGTNKAGNPWRKATVVVETIGDYPKHIALTAFNSTLDAVANLALGTILDIGYDVESRSWTDPKTNRVRWFTDAILRNSELHAQPQPQPQPQAVRPKEYQTAMGINPPALSPDDETDDLPF